MCVDIQDGPLLGTRFELDSKIPAGDVSRPIFRITEQCVPFKRFIVMHIHRDAATQEMKHTYGHAMNHIVEPFKVTEQHRMIRRRNFLDPQGRCNSGDEVFP